MTDRSAPFAVLTCADAGYYHFLPYFEQNVGRKFGRLPLIYDLGLTSEQRATLASDVVSVEVPPGFRDTDPRHGFIMTTHKPACIADSLDRSPGGCLYVDSDVLFVEPVTAADLAGADVAVTPRHPKERTPTHLDNGSINAGVLFFSGSPVSRALLVEWSRACDAGDRTDQKALSDLLADFDLDRTGLEVRNGLRLLKLDPRIFNDVALRTGRVLHFKSAGREPRVARRLAAFRQLEERHPRAFAAWLRLRRSLLR